MQFDPRTKKVNLTVEHRTNHLRDILFAILQILDVRTSLAFTFNDFQNKRAPIPTAFHDLGVQWSCLQIFTEKSNNCPKIEK